MCALAHLLGAAVEPVRARRLARAGMVCAAAWAGGGAAVPRGRVGCQ